MKTESLKSKIADLQPGDSFEKKIPDSPLSDTSARCAQTFLELVLTVSTSFINLPTDQTDAGINDALRLVGDFAQADRSYVFQLSQDGHTMDNTHEWCARSIDSQVHQLQDIPVSSLPGSMRESVEVRLSTSPTCPSFHLRQKLKNRVAERKNPILINVPIVCRGTLVGFIGFDAVREKRPGPMTRFPCLGLWVRSLQMPLSEKAPWNP